MYMLIIISHSCRQKASFLRPFTFYYITSYVARCITHQDKFTYWRSIDFLKSCNLSRLNHHMVRNLACTRCFCYWCVSWWVANQTFLTHQKQVSSFLLLFSIVLITIKLNNEAIPCSNLPGTVHAEYFINIRASYTNNIFGNSHHKLFDFRVFRYAWMLSRQFQRRAKVDIS